MAPAGKWQLPPPPPPLPCGYGLSTCTVSGTVHTRLPTPSSSGISQSPFSLSWLSSRSQHLYSHPRGGAGIRTQIPHLPALAPPLRQSACKCKARSRVQLYTGAHAGGTHRQAATTGCPHRHPTAQALALLSPKPTLVSKPLLCPLHSQSRTCWAGGSTTLTNYIPSRNLTQTRAGRYLVQSALVLGGCWLLGCG